MTEYLGFPANPARSWGGNAHLARHVSGAVERGEAESIVAVEHADRARVLALGYSFAWSDDWHVGSHADEYGDAYRNENGDPTEPDTCEQADLLDPDGEIVQSLGCIDDADDDYRCQVEDDLAAEQLRMVHGA